MLIKRGEVVKTEQMVLRPPAGEVAYGNLNAYPKELGKVFVEVADVGRLRIRHRQIGVHFCRSQPKTHTIVMSVIPVFSFFNFLRRQTLMHVCVLIAPQLRKGRTAGNKTNGQQEDKLIFHRL